MEPDKGPEGLGFRVCTIVIPKEIYLGFHVGLGEDA